MCAAKRVPYPASGTKKHRRLFSGAGYDLLLPAAVPGLLMRDGGIARQYGAARFNSRNRPPFWVLRR